MPCPSPKSRRLLSTPALSGAQLSHAELSWVSSRGEQSRGSLLHLDPGPTLFPPNRKCKLVTSGPWLEVAPIALSDVSIIPESADANGRGHNIALWAVSDKGDVLCRLGVSELNPAVSTSPLGIVPVFRISGTSGVFLERHLASGFPRFPQVSPAQNGSPG